MNWVNYLWAELKKEHRNEFHNYFIYFSLLIWPVISFVTAYYSFKPFPLDASSPLARLINPDHLILFLLTGYLGYIFFWCLVQSAWRMSFERHSGTLEMIFLSPVNRVVFIYGRSFSAMIEGAWLFLSFVLLTLFFVDGIEMYAWWSAPLAFIILSVSAVVWGGLLNAVFLFSRDASFLYTILDEPMLIFSGVRIPPLAFPFWAKLISLIFPLTYALNIIRKLLMEKASLIDIAPQLALLSCILSVMILISWFVVKRAESYMKKTGNMVLF